MVEDEIAQIEAGIAAQEALRSTLGDTVVDAVTAALRGRIADLRARAAVDGPAAALSALHAALGGTLAPEVAARFRAAREGEAERRPVTALALDLRAAATTLAAAAPASRATMFAELAREVQAVVLQHAGFPLRLDATVLVVVFGAPAVHEDDPARAMRSALDLRARLDALSARWGSSAALAAGVATGVVTAGPGASGYEVSGPAIDAAAALAREAPVGTIAHTVDDRRETASVRGAFVGRERELAALTAVGDDLGRGRSHVVVVTGDGGIGKSRLVAEWRAAMGERTRWIEGRGFAHTSAVAFGPIIDLLRSLAGGDEGAVADRARVDALCARLAPGVTGAPALLARLLGFVLAPDEEALLARRSPQDVRQELVAFLHGAFGRLAHERPTVLLVEDLHWSDVTSLEVLETLVPMLRRLPLALVLLARPGAPGGEGGADAGRLIAAAERSGAALTRIGLAPLDPASARAIVADRVGDAAQPIVDAVTRSALERAEGNPFFLEEIVRSLVAQGLLGPAAGERVAVPETPARVLQAQLDRLPLGARRLAQLASVLGRQFPEATLRAVADDADVDEALRVLEREGILRRRRGPEAAWSFRHALLLDASYESLVPERRRALHRRVGEALARTEDPAVVGAHFARAERWDRAEEHLTRAGEAAFGLHAHTEARGHYGRAIDALRRRPDRDDRRREWVALIIRYDAVSYLHDPPEENLARLAEALSALDQLAQRGDADPDDARLRGQALVSQGRLRSILGNQSAARASLAEALAIAEALGDERLAALPSAALGVVAAQYGSFREAEGRLRRGLGVLGGEGSSDFWYLAKGYLALVCAILGHGVEARAEADDALAAARRSGNSRLVARCGWTAGVAYLFTDGAAESMAFWTESIASAQESGDRMLEEIALRYRAATESRLGAHARADETLVEAAAVRADLSAPMFFEDWFLSMEAEISLRAGRLDEALARADAAAANAETRGSAFSRGLAHAAAGLALAMRPAPDRSVAKARFAVGLGLLEECGAVGEAARWRGQWDAVTSG